MVIQKKENLKDILLNNILLFLLAILPWHQCEASTGVANEAADLNHKIEILQKTLGQSGGDVSSGKIEYNLGVLLFKKGEYEEAICCFENVIARKVSGNLLVVSHNMIGQAAFLLSDYELARNQFEFICESIASKAEKEKLSFDENNIWFYACVGLCNISEVMCSYNELITDCNRVLACIENNQKFSNMSPSYIDKKAQVYFLLKDFEKYFIEVDKLISEYHDYERISDVQFEKILVRYVQNNDVAISDSLKIHELFVEIISKSSIDNLSTFVTYVTKGCEHDSIKLINITAYSYLYSYALDCVGRDSEALELLNGFENGDENTSLSINYYAGILKVMILSENGKYEQAISLLTELAKEKYDDEHCVKLIDAIKEGILTLKREGING